MATRTAKGLAALKDTGLDVTLAGVSVSENHSPIVIVGFHDVTLPDTVLAGNREMKKVIQRINQTSGFGTAIYYLRKLKRTNTRDFTASWSVSPGARFIAVVTVDIPLLFFESTGDKATTASPTTSANTNDLPVHNCFHIAAHVAQGPTNDAELSFPADWTAGQRGGTDGGAPASNLCMSEAFKFGRCIDPEECTSTGTDSRAYCSVLASFKPLPEMPAFDGSGAEIEIGDSVSFQGGNYTVQNIIREVGFPYCLVDLGGGIVTQSYNVDLI